MKWSHSVARLWNYDALTSMDGNLGVVCFVFATDVLTQFQRYTMKPKPTECSVTADGYEVRPGDTVYVTSNGNPFEKRTVKTCYAKMIDYADPDPADYTGAKLTVVYKDPRLYIWYLVQVKYGFAPYWMNDGGSHWLKMGGGETPKRDGDRVFEIAYGSYRELDHKKTGLYKCESKIGWLNREGRLYSCRYYEHDIYARLILHSAGSAMLEKCGWVRILRGKQWTSTKQLNDDQLRWLYDHGYEVDDYEDVKPWLER